MQIESVLLIAIALDKTYSFIVIQQLVLAEDELFSTCIISTTGHEKWRIYRRYAYFCR